MVTDLNPEIDKDSTIKGLRYKFKDLFCINQLQIYVNMFAENGGREE